MHQRFGAEAATFGWLCVETVRVVRVFISSAAATFGWLCVETTARAAGWGRRWQPPSGGCVLKLHVVALGRLFDKQPPSGGCVLKLNEFDNVYVSFSSHLRVAVC